MRWLLDILAVLAIVGVLAGILAFQRDRQAEDAKVQQVISDLRRLQLELKFRSAANGAELNRHGWPETIDAAWFENDPPRNALLSGDRPWIEVASAEERELDDPLLRMAINENLAGFWYNPYRGVVRVRVPVGVNDDVARRLYNRINGTTLKSIFVQEPPTPLGPRDNTEAAPHGDGSDAGVERESELSEAALDPTKPAPKP